MNFCKRILLLALIVANSFGLACCNRTVNEGKAWLYGEMFLSAQPLYLDTLIAMPGSITIRDSLLIVEERMNSKLFTVFTIREDYLEKAGDFMSSGRGPYEVMAGYGSYVHDDNSYMIVGYNFYGRTISIPLKDGVSSFFSLDSWKVYDSPEIFSAMAVIPMNSETLLLQQTAADSDNMFFLFDLPTGQMNELGVTLPDDNVNAPLDYKVRHIYIGRFGVRPGHEQFVYSSTYGQIVTIYNLREGRVENITPVYDELPKYYYDASKNRIRRYDANRWGYNTAVTSKYIYLGDLKMTDGDFSHAMDKNGFRLGDTNEIQVFDWQGKPITKLHLDRAVSFYAVDDSDNYLYAFAYDEETLEDRLVRFKLPDLNNQTLL